MVWLVTTMTSTATPARKRKSPSSSTAAAESSSENPHYALAQSITNIRKGQEQFRKAVDATHTLIEDTFTNLQLKLETKEREAAENERVVENTKRQRRIDMEQELKEFGYDAVKKIL